ncbi:ATP-binding protein [Blautia sp. HCP3S3_H10_1]|uniref:sensor histidine kinase n=1 Tax=unclassified Blautia TaxID=2648079 RepID=UPI003F8E4F37|nr:HAMP domain-containing sensor histidine kinase [Clostridia bacterium]
MRKTVHSKLIGCYILIGILSFLFATAGGSHSVENYLEDEVGSRLYESAEKFASEETTIQQITDRDIKGLQKITDLLASGEGIDILVLDKNSNILVQSSDITDSFSAQPVTDGAAKAYTEYQISGFDPELWKNRQYIISSFYGYFSGLHLNIAVPVESSSAAIGYVTFHYDMQQLYQKRSGLLGILQMVFLVVYLLCGLLIICYQLWIHLPLQQIIKGASEYANGDLTYRIPVKSEDEMGYLANTLNYMADKINQNGEYQRTFIANVSHDFRSPLTSIKGYVEAILDGTIPPEMQDKYLNIISHEADRLEKLTRSLLVLNDLDEKKRMMNIRRFDINDVIKNTANTFEGTCSKKNIDLELLLFGKELYVEADMEQIQQVLYNLLDNAIKFSNDNSSINIETSVKNGKVFVSVKDHGIGIPKESLSKVWDRFYKTDPSRGKDRKGTGLGLSIVKEIINAHDQNINVISTEGVGTEFIFTLKKAGKLERI